MPTTTSVEPLIDALVRMAATDTDWVRGRGPTGRPGRGSRDGVEILLDAP